MPAAFKISDAIPGHPKSPTSAFDACSGRCSANIIEYNLEKVNCVKNLSNKLWLPFGRQRPPSVAGRVQRSLQLGSLIPVFEVRLLRRSLARRFPSEVVGAKRRFALSHPSPYWFGKVWHGIL